MYKKSDDEKYESDYCLKIFSTKSNLTRHLMCHTDNTDKHSCSWCKALFARKSNLKRHEEAHHKLRGDIGYIFSEEKQKAKANINCDFCHKSFTRKSNLNDHIKGFHKLTSNSA